MKQIILLFYLLIQISSCWGQIIRGKVICNNKNVANVIVSDGYTCTQTDKDGNYSIEVNDSAHCVFIVTPSGYIAEEKYGHPQFYKNIKSDSFDFKLKKWKQADKKYQLMAIADPQPKGDLAFKRFKDEALPDIRKSMSTNRPAFALFLGDLLWDNLDEYERLKKLLAQMGMPYYTVIGNHDHDANIADDNLSTSTYQKHFGPTNYAFNVGKDYFIVLDNIIYAGNKKYTCGFSTQTLNWLSGYLKYLPKGAHLFIAMHAPAHYYQSNYKLRNADRFMKLLEDFQVDILSGHMHIQSNFLIKPNIREYNIASIGGTWWLWDCKLCKDGTPYGYQIFESSDKGLFHFYHSVGKPDTFQFKILPSGSIKKYEDKLCIKVWNWDERWKVEWIEDGVLKGEMHPFKATDPEYGSYLNKKYAQGKHKVDKFRQPVNNVYFFFYAPVTKGTKQVEIMVTDAYGRKYRQHINL